MSQPPAPHPSTAPEGGRTLWLFAALALLLQWFAPAGAPGLDPRLADLAARLAPATASEQPATSRGERPHLPAVEVRAPKDRLTGGPKGDSLLALLPSDFRSADVSAPLRAARPADAPVPSQPPRPFDPRGPPA